MTDEQWADIQKCEGLPVRVESPGQGTTFVLLRAQVYERFKSLFKEDPLTEKERLNQLQQFGVRAGWDDPEMNVYDELDPRRAS